MIKLQLYGLLRIMLSGKAAIDLPWAEGETVGRVLLKFQSVELIPVNHKLIDEHGALHTGTIILVNRKNILHINGLDTPVQDNDVLSLFPPGAGG